MKNKFPLMDGQTFINVRGDREVVMGEISVDHTEPICYTTQSNWYRRSDGEQMTGANGKVMTAKEFYRLRRIGKL